MVDNNGKNIFCYNTDVILISLKIFDLGGGGIREGDIWEECIF